MEADPFPDIHVTDGAFLDSLDGRSICSLCQKSRKYFCYTCYIPVSGLEGKIPQIKLPIKVDIIKHATELDGKSTSVHAKLLAPDDVNIYTYPCIPDYEDRDKVILVFPGKEAVLMEELLKPVISEEKLGSSKHVDSSEFHSDLEICTDSLTTGSVEKEHSDNYQATGDTRYSTTSTRECCACEKRKRNYSFFERVVFIDGTWSQTNKMLSDERLEGTRRIQLKNKETKFWRHQKNHPDTHLSTIEAIYYFLREYHELCISDQYSGEYDDMLFFFVFMYQKIRTMHNGGSHLRVFKERLSEKNMTSHCSY